MVPNGAMEWWRNSRWRWLLPPDMDDAVQQHQARALWVVLWLALLISGLLFAHILVDPHRIARIATVGLTASAVLVGVLVLVAQRRVRLACRLTVVLFWLLTTFVIATEGGLHSPVLMAYVVLVLLAGQLYGTGGGVVMGAVCVAAAVAIGLLGAAGRLPVVADRSNAGILLTAVHQIVSVVSLQAVAAWSVREAIGRYRAELVERQRAEEALRESQQLLLDVNANIPGVVFQFYALPDGEFGLRYVSQRMPTVTGLEAEPLNTLFDRFAERLAPPDRARFVDTVKQAVERVEPWFFESRLTKPSGEVIWFTAHSIPLPSEGVLLFNGVLLDVTERRQAADALAASENRFRGMVEQSPFSTLVLSPTGEVQVVNEASVRLWGVTTEQTVGYNILADPVLNAYGLIPLVRRAFDGERVSLPAVDYDLSAALGHGTRRTVQGDIFPIRGADGEVSSVVVVHQDITERVHAEEALRASEQRFRTLIEDAPVAIAISRAGRYTYANPAYCRMSGFDSPDEVIGHEYTEWVAPECQAEFDARGRRREGGLPAETHYELTALRRDGSRFHVAATANRVVLADGPATVGFFHDITERKRAEEQLNAALRQLDDILEFLPDSIFVIDRSGQVVAWNRAIETLTGVPKAAVLGCGAPAYANAIYGHGRPCLIDLLDADLATTGPLYDALTRQGETLRGEACVTDLGGRGPAYLWAVAAPLYDRDGRRTGAIEVIHDITDRRHREEEREAMIRQLSQINEELERFTYTVSHDLKSPLITISGFLGRLRSDLTAGRLAQADRNIARMEQATAHMARLLEELLELSRIGRLVNPPETVALGHLVAMVKELLAGSIAANGVRVEAIEPLPQVHGDRQRLREVMQNLIENAIRFSAGCPDAQVAVGCAGVDDERGWPLCYVRDNGSGFAPAYAERIFGLFEQLEPGRGGTGIGLALVRRIIEVHGGRVWAESAGPGQGACFWFTLPPPPG